MLRICVYGAGAVGGNLAVRLARAGSDVSVITRGPNLQAMRARGLRLMMPGGAPPVAAPVRATDTPADLGPQDAVIVTAKAVPEAAAALADGISVLLGPETLVVHAQNGIPWWYGRGGVSAPDLGFLDPDGRFAAAVGARAVGCVVYSANEVVEPGVVQQVSPDPHRWVLGMPDGSSPGALRALSAAMQAGGVEAPVVPDIRRALWTKLLNNVAQNPVCCLLGQPLSILGRDPALLALSKALMAEVVAVCAAHGQDLGVDIESRFGQRTLTSPHKPSMLQDMEAGRPMEDAAILEAPRRFAQAAGVAVPHLDAAVALLSRRAVDLGLYTPPA